MGSRNSKSLTSMDLINEIDQPYFIERIFEEHKQVMETEVPPTLNAGPENRLLFKHNRINLPGEEDSTIINASYIQGYKRPNAYIVTETPQSEVEAQALWETVWQHRTNIIVMLNKPEENEKGYCYWSPEAGTSLQFGRLRVNTVEIRSILPTLEIRELEVINEKGDSLTVYHFLYLNWQHYNILPSTDDFLKFLLTVREHSKNVVRSKGYHRKPKQILVHCSNGLDRTMVYCAIDISISKYLRTSKVNLFSTVKKLKQQRFNCMSIWSHYFFCYGALHNYFVSGSSAS